MLEHLRNQIGDKDTSDMTPEELQFYYFKQHDYDNNNMLDGIELIQGICSAVKNLSKFPFQKFWALNGQKNYFRDSEEVKVLFSSYKTTLIYYLVIKKVKICWFFMKR